MRIVWTLFKIMLGLAIVIPLAMVALALTAGVVKVVVGLAIMVVRLACVGVVGYGLYRLARLMFAPAKKAAPSAPRELPNADPYYTAAMRELDAELRN